MVAAAIIGGAVVGAAGTAIAGGEAANATDRASQQAASTQQQTLAQQATLSAPYRGVGEAAIPKYEALLGLGPDGSAGILEALKQTPGYQFALDQGQEGIVNKASLTGGVGGNTLADLTKFNQGLATQTLGTERAALAGAVGEGQAAAAGQAQNVGQAGANLSSIYNQQGQTIAGIDANVAAGITKSIGNAGDQYIGLQTLKALQAQSSGSGAVT